MLNVWLIYLHLRVVSGVNVGKETIHWASGILIRNLKFNGSPPESEKLPSQKENSVPTFHFQRSMILIGMYTLLIVQKSQGQPPGMLLKPCKYRIKGISTTNINWWVYRILNHQQYHYTILTWLLLIVMKFFMSCLGWPFFPAKWWANGRNKVGVIRTNQLQIVSERTTLLCKSLVKENHEKYINM